MSNLSIIDLIFATIVALLTFGMGYMCGFSRGMEEGIVMEAKAAALRDMRELDRRMEETRIMVNEAIREVEKDGGES